MVGKLIAALGAVACAAVVAVAAAGEYNPVRGHQVSIGPRPVG